MKKAIKKTISILLAVVMLFGTAPLAGLIGIGLPEWNLFSTKAEAATSGTCGDNLTWMLDTETGELVICGEGEMMNWNHWYDIYAPWYSSAANIKIISLSEGITTIGDYSFYGCYNLEKINIPNAVTKIGSNSFFGCSKIKEIILPYGVRTIGSAAFMKCSSITELSIPDTVTVIGSEALKWTSSLEKLTLPFIGNSKSEKRLDYLGYIFGNANFGTSGAVRQYLGEITSYSTVDYYISTSLRSITITDSKSIPFGALSGCYFLTEIILQNSLSDIEAFAFKNCSGLKKIVIPENVSAIGEEAFYNCSNLTDVYYMGTAEQWKKIEIGKNNSPLGTATIHYGHTHSADTTENRVDPTCSESGYIEYICACGYRFIENILPLNHKETLVKVDKKAPTCTEIGWDAYEYCTACDYTTYTEKVALKHNIIIDETVDATCTATGLTAGQHCSRCDDATVTQEVVPAKNHKDTLVQVGAHAPTCTEIGWETYEYCTACDYTTYIEKGALEHDIIIDEAVESTCTSTGLTAGQHCSRCDDMTIAQEIVPSKPHNPTEKYDSSKHWNECGCGLITDEENHSFFGGNICSCGYKRTTNAIVSIKNNTGSKTINYGETLKLTAVVTNKPTNAKIYWYIDGVKSGEGEVFNISFENGTKIVTVKLVDENGVAYEDANGSEITDSETITVKAGFFQKLISFFKNLFGSNRTVVQAIFKGIF